LLSICESSQLLCLEQEKSQVLGRHLLLRHGLVCSDMLMRCCIAILWGAAA